VIVHAVALASSSTSLGVSVPVDFIDALDNSIREELQRTSHMFFLCVLISAFVVAAGVALEGPELLHEMWPKVFTPFTKGSVTRIRKFKRFIKKIGFWGWLLVVVGIVGEGVFEALQNRAEGQLQTFNDILLTDARRHAGEAGERAADANERASANEKEAERLNKEAEDERMARVELEKQVSPRSLSKKQSDALVRQLRAAPSGGSLTIESARTSEASGYAMDLRQAVMMSNFDPGSNVQSKPTKWEIEGFFDRRGQESMPLPDFSFIPLTAVAINCTDKADCAEADVIADAFECAGLERPTRWSFLDWPVVLIVVGEHPAVATPEEQRIMKAAIKKDKDEATERRVRPLTCGK
jgi:hypothetical protein